MPICVEELVGSRVEYLFHLEFDSDDGSDGWQWCGGTVLSSTKRPGWAKVAFDDAVTTSVLLDECRSAWRLEATVSPQPIESERCYSPASKLTTGKDKSKENQEGDADDGELENWSTEHKWVGRRCTRTFRGLGNDISIGGTVISWLACKRTRNRVVAPALWKLRHDDGDVENLDEFEVKTALTAQDLSPVPVPISVNGTSTENDNENTNRSRRTSTAVNSKATKSLSRQYANTSSIVAGMNLAGKHSTVRSAATRCPRPPTKTTHVAKRARSARPSIPSGEGEPVLRADNVRRWFAYIAERQRVYRKWLSNYAPPYTSDQIIAHGRMCNNFRYLDRETTWLVANILLPLRHNPADLLFNVLLFRVYLNSYKTMELLGLQRFADFDPIVFMAKLHKINTMHGKLSSGAYQVGSFEMFRSADDSVPAGAAVKPARVGLMFEQLAPHMEQLVRRIMVNQDSSYTYRRILHVVSMCRVYVCAGTFQQQTDSSLTVRYGRYNAIISCKGVGKFIGWQVCLDIGYIWPQVYDEHEHVIVGVC